MDLYALEVGARARTVDNDVVEVVEGTEDGEWIKVRYLESAEHPELVGTEDLCSENEIIERVLTV